MYWDVMSEMAKFCCRKEQNIKKNTRVKDALIGKRGNEKEGNGIGGGIRN